MSLLTVENLTTSFHGSGGDVAAVKNVSFSMEKGELLALVGESGSGKTVTALSILGLLPYPAAFHHSGQIAFKGQPILSASAPRPSLLSSLRGNRISMIFQEPMSALNPLHTIGKQIGEMLWIHQQLGGKAATARIKELLALVGLAHFSERLDAYPHQLSGGERQRVMIAMAIANHPDLLIADEPTTALDVTIQIQILSLLKRLQKELNMSVLLITHDLTIVRRIADRVAVMQAGQIVEQGTVSEVMQHPKHSYTQTLLASEPKGNPLPLDKNAPVILSCEQLCVTYPKSQGLFGFGKTRTTVLDGVSLTVAQGSTLGIVGESGSGKTTLGLALLRLIKSKGRIVFMGDRLDTLKTQELRPKRKHMQIVFQDPYGSLNPRMPVGQIIAEGLKIHAPKSSTDTLVDDILVEVGLSPDIKDRYPHEFSGGQRQRISIARALVLKPKLIILDEPTSALDLSIQAQIITLLRELQRKHGITFLFISHDLRVVRALSHQVIVLRQGRIVEEGSAEALFANPKQDYTKALIQAAFAS